MAGQAHQASARRRGADKGVRLAVYHASTNVRTTPGRASAHEAIQAALFFSAADAHADPGDGGRGRAVGVCAGSEAEPAAAAFDRARARRWCRTRSIQDATSPIDPVRLGFTTHLKAPLSPVEIEHQLALAAPVDLATRFRQFQPTLRRYLNRVGIIGEMTRAVNASMDPERVAEATGGTRGRVAARAMLGGGRLGTNREPEGNGPAQAGAFRGSGDARLGKLGSAQQPGVCLGQPPGRSTDAPARRRYCGRVSGHLSWPHGGRARGVWTVGPRHETRKAHPRRSPCSAGSYSRLPFRSVTL